MGQLKVGDSFPDGVAFTYIPATPGCADIKTCGVPQTLDASNEFNKKKVVLVSVPGAFTPVCQASHLPSYMTSVEVLKAKGVDHVVIIAYNDAYVMSAWAKANGVSQDFLIFASDDDAKFSKSIGWTIGQRTSRYAIVIDHGKVIYASQDDDTMSIDRSGAQAVLAHM